MRFLSLYERHTVGIQQAGPYFFPVTMAWSLSRLMSWDYAFLPGSLFCSETGKKMTAESVSERERALTACPESWMTDYGLFLFCFW